MPSPRPTNDLTDGDLAWPMLKLAWPLVVIQLLQVTYNVADTFWLGAYSTDAVGALSLAFPLIFFLISIGGGFTAAGAILVAQYAGARSDDAAGRVAGQTLAFATLVAVGIGVLGYLLTPAMLAAIPADPQTQARIVPMAGAYMRVFFLGLPFLFGFFGFTALMRGYGQTRVPMRIMVVSVAVNLVLDPLLIFGAFGFPHLGIRGAAVATIVARAVAAALGWYVLFGTSHGPAVGVRDLVLDAGIVRKIVRLGVPSALEQSTSSLAMIAMTAIVATFPPAVVAAYGLGNRLSSLVFLPAMGLGMATNTMVGQNLGAGEAGRAERAVYLAAKLVGAVMLVVAVVAFLFPGAFVAPFVSTGTAQAAETVRIGGEYLRVLAFSFVFMGVFQVVLGAFRGAGNTTTALVFSFVSLWIARVPVTAALVFWLGWGASGVWWGMTVGVVVGALAALAWFRRGTWTDSAVEDVDEGDGRRSDGLDVPGTASPLDD